MPSNTNAVSYDTAEQKTFSVNDLIERWNMPRKRILSAIRSGRLHAFKAGLRVYSVTLDEVKRFEQAQEEAA